MSNLYKLHNQIKHYAWGSADFIPRLLGMEGDGTPWAELWMGSHSSLSSRVNVPSGSISLGELIATDTHRYLGEKAAERYGELPFLLKLLAVEKPLSIQAHPNMAQAREGFERENKAQLALNDNNRNYRDPNHKPEIICALTPFTGMCGFRSPDEITRLLSVFRTAPAPLRESFNPLLRTLEMRTLEKRTLEMPDAAIALRNFLDALFSLSPAAREALTQFVLSVQGADARSADARGAGEEWELVREFARLYPGDPTIIAPLYLSVFHLEPGEAVFLKAGAPHSYIHGCGVELMANSDNVLRGGLTAKHVDVPELMRALDFNSVQPRIIKPEAGSGCFTYPAPCDEFSLTVMGGKASGKAAGAPQSMTLARNAPAICIVTEGEVSIDATDGTSGTVLKQGEAVFIPPATGGTPLVFRGDYTLFAATVPGQNFRP